jgi:hypothetical protein
LHFVAAEAAFTTTPSSQQQQQQQQQRHHQRQQQHQQRKDDAFGRRFDGIPAHQWSRYNHGKIFRRQAAKLDAMASASLEQEQEIKEETRIGSRESSRTTARHDKKWLEQYEKLKAYRTQQGHCNVPRTEGTLGLWILTQRNALKNDRLRQDRKELLDEIGFAWSLRRGSGSPDERWVEQYKHLKTFREEYDHCNVPKRQGSLGQWVMVQRRFYRNGCIRQDRKELLDEIGFVWIIVANTELLGAAKDSKYWMEQYERLKAFRNENGHCCVPYASEGSLGRWAVTQRQTFRTSQMRQDRKDLLNEIGFVWKAQEENWMEQYDRLKAFRNEHGHCSIPSSGSLTQWVLHQRRTRNRMRQDRRDLLNEIGFVWGLQDEWWQQSYEELQLFHTEYGHCNVPLTELPLYQWVQRQRQLLKKGRMRKDRKELFEKIGFVVNLQDDRWQRNYEKLKRFQVENGHCNAPLTEKSLNSWVSAQRQRFSQGRMRKDRVQLLEKIDFV